MKCVVRLLVVLCVLPSVIGRAVAQVPTDTEQAFANLRGLLDRGAYAEAERGSKELSARIEAERGPDSLDLARALDLSAEALIRNGKAAASSTLALAERTVRLKEQLVGGEHLETATSLHNLGAVYVQRGDAGVAMRQHERALSIRARQLATDDSAIAESLDYLAAAMIKLERFEEARPVLARALSIREARHDEEPIALARTLESVAWLNRYSGNYDAAAPLVDRALAIRRRSSPDDPDMGLAIELQGDVLFLRGDIAGAQRAWTEAFALSERTLGVEHPTLVAVLRRLAQAAMAFGNLTERRRLLERGLEIADRSLAPCDRELAALLNSLGRSLEYDGEYAQARSLYRRALGAYEKCLGPGNSLTATVIHNEAELSSAVGDFEAAERMHKQAIRLWSTSLRPNHPYVARGLDALARVVESRGHRARARVLYQRALAIRRRAIGADHPDVAWTLTNLARVSADSGNVRLALRDVNQAIDIYQRVGVSDEPDHLARALELRGEIEANQGDHRAARASFAEALSTRERIFGTAHPLAAEARAEVASADFALGSHHEALGAALDAERAGRDQLRFTVRYLPERQALAYADKRPRGLNLALSILTAGRVSRPSSVFDSVVQSRGVILDELAARAQSAVGSDPELASLNSSLVAARQRFANLMLRSLGEGDPVPRAILDEARQQKEDAERALAERSVAVRSELARANLGLSDVSRALPQKAALVSFVRYDRTFFVENSSHARVARNAPSYVAFVLRADAADVAAVPMGSASAIDALVARWRGATTGVIRSSSPSEAEKSYRAAGTALKRRVWDPLREHLKDAQTVFVVPDGTLNLVSLAALPVGQTKYLIDEGPVIHYLSAERDLVVGETPSTGSRGLLAVGGAAFDDVSSFARVARRPASTTRAPVGTGVAAGTSTAVATLRAGDRLAANCGTFQSLRFQPLAGTRQEVREIARLWTDSPAQVLESRDASERAFKREAPGHRVLHLATHGFFLGSCSTAGSGTRSVGGLATKAKSQPKLGLGESPLLMSGLALAGANKRAAAGPDDEDGILTAEEVTALNLEGVEWAVLSACDTGLGEVKAGEGVFGLRRAFQVAGVRTVIMSLWPVDDQAARLWMRALYESRLQKHLSTAEAMHEASLSVLRDRRARHQSTHPFYWGAFVAAGDWR